jgi:rhodanese-related sulfurtransferase
VDKRIDVIATAIRAGMTVRDLAELELSYAPPFGSAKDPVNMAGFMASNVLDGILPVWPGSDLEALDGGTVLLDARSGGEYARGHLPGALNIPHTELRARMAEVPQGRPVRVYCASGFRSYLALRVLAQNGFGDVRSLSGGIATLRLELPDLALEKGTPATVG